MRLIAQCSLLLLAILIVAGCGDAKQGGDGSKSNNAGGDTSSDKSANDAGDKKKVTIAYVTNQVANFWNIAAVGAKDAGEQYGVNVEVRFPSEANASKQKQIIEDLMSSGIDALAVSPPDAENQVDMINEWCKKIPTITHDSDAPGSDRIMCVGMDNYRGGRMLGKLIKNSFPDGAKMVLTVGRMEQDNAQKRRQGVIDELLDRSMDKTRLDPMDGVIENEKYTIYATLTDGGDSIVAKQKAEDALNKYPDINLFVGLFEYNPPACLQAIKQANKLDSIKVAGFDENDLTLQGIKDGTVIGTVVQNPYEYGFQSVYILSEILKGNNSVVPESKFIDCPARAVTKTGAAIGEMETENVDDFWTDKKDKIGN